MTRFLLLLSLLSPAIAHAEIEVFACEPEWAALAEEIGGDLVDAYAATTGFQDPHYIQARPSLIAKVRQADLVICSGAQLEIGWLPALLQKANNPGVMPGSEGYLEASSFVMRLDATGIPVRKPYVYAAEINPQLHLFGDTTDLQLEGNVDISDLRYVREFEFLRQAMIRPRVYEEEEPLWAEVPTLRQLKLNLAMQTTGQAVVRNRYADLELSGGLTVTGTLFGGGTIIQSFAVGNLFESLLLTGFNDVTSVLFQGSASGNFGEVGFELDNLNTELSAPVPAPATLALFGLGLAGLGWSRRKKA